MVALWALHIEGKIQLFEKNGHKKFPTHVGRLSRFFLGKFFGKFEIGHFFCPFSKSENIFCSKSQAL
jgi:hypothetical protein